MSALVAESIPVLNTVVHAAVQLAAAMGAGSVLDYAASRLFTLAEGQQINSPRQALIEALEVAAQVVAGGMLTGAIANYLVSLPAESADPANGLIFGVVFFGVAQPVLQERLARVTAYVRNMVLRPQSTLADASRRLNSVVGAANSYNETMARHRRVGTVPQSVLQYAQSPNKINSVQGLDTGKY